MKWVWRRSVGERNSNSTAERQTKEGYEAANEAAACQVKSFSSLLTLSMREYSKWNSCLVFDLRLKLRTWHLHFRSLPMKQNNLIFIRYLESRFYFKATFLCLSNTFMSQIHYNKSYLQILLIIITFLLGGSELSLRSSPSLHCSTSTSSSSSTSSSTSSSSVEWRLSEWRFVDGGDAEDLIVTSPSSSDFVEKFRPGWKNIK